MACLVALAGCGEPLVPDPPPSPAGPPPAAAVAPSAASGAIAADAAELPRVKDVVESLLKPGCVLHYRTLSDLYVEHRFELEFSPAAREASGRVGVLLYGVNVTLKRPTSDAADAEMETLPKGLGIRSVCKIPDTALGESEALAFIEARLREKGIDVAANSAQGPAARGPLAEAARLAWSGVRGVWRWLAPRPLSAAQRIEFCEDDSADPDDAVPHGSLPAVGIKCTIIEITVTCPFGFDYEASSGNCVGGLSSSTPIVSTPIVFIPPGGSSPGGPGPANPAEPGENGEDEGEDEEDDILQACDDARDGLATELAMSEQYGGPHRSCDEFFKDWWLIRQDADTENGLHEGYGYIDDALYHGLDLLGHALSPSMLHVTSGYRCPNGDLAAPGGTGNGFHTYGRAADVYEYSIRVTEDRYPTPEEFAILEELAWEAGARTRGNYADRHLHVVW